MTAANTSLLKKLLLAFLVFAGLYYAKPFLMPLAIGGVLATLFLPFCNWMEARKTPRWLAALICLLTLLFLIIGLGALLGWQISELTNDISLVKQKIMETIQEIQRFIFTHFGISPETQSQAIKQEQPSFTGIIQFAAGPITVVFTNCILVLAYVFLFVYYRVHIRHFLLRLSKPAQQNEMEQVINSAAHVSQQYLAGLSKMIVCLWIMYSIGFGIAGVNNFIFFAILCGLLEIVPFIGNLTGSTLTLLVCAVHGASLPMLAGIAFTYGAVQFIQGWILEPLIVGRQVKINPLFTIIALVVGELVWGIPGIILAIPITAIFKIICDHIESLKPYGFLIGEIETQKKKSHFYFINKARHKKKRG